MRKRKKSRLSPAGALKKKRTRLLTKGGMVASLERKKEGSEMEGGGKQMLFGR